MLAKLQSLFLLTLPLLLGGIFYTHSYSLLVQFGIMFSLPFLLVIKLIKINRVQLCLGLSLVIGTCSIGLPSWSVLNQTQLINGFYFDWVNLPFLFLTSLFFPYVILTSANSVRGNKTFFCWWLLLMEIFLLILFSTLNFFVFYVFFELLAFPMFLLIGVYGSQPARISAAYKFFLYTFMGSIFMLAGLISLYYFYGSCSVFFLTQIDSHSQIYFFFLVFFALAVKVPTVPFHLWLPEAHVEAPTGISVLLAALLLKTGGYGFIRFVLPLFPVGVHFWSSLVLTLSLISILFASWWATTQVDMKKTIAYSSVAHMNVVMLGLFSGSVLAVQASTYMMLAHAFVSAGLFTGVGVIYDRYHTRSIRALSGLVSYMPQFCFWYFFLILANFSFPFSGNFCSELVVFSEVIYKNLFVGLVGGLTVFFSSLYSIWFFNRVFYGPPTGVVIYQDLTSNEWGGLAFCVLGMLGLGFYSSEYAQISLEDYCQTLNYFIF